MEGEGGKEREREMEGEVERERVLRGRESIHVNVDYY